tara:strand:- start:254 stop:478 length:225 start_codon:yes stop_codon:yes gene_type:complete
MIKSKSEQPHPPRHEIDLTGEDGNAYALMAYASKYAKQLDMEVSPIINEMTAGDYEQLVEVFDRYFGHFVTLYR